MVAGLAVVSVVVVAVVVLSGGGDGGSDASGVERFRELAAERDQSFPGLADDERLASQAQRQCEDLTPLSVSVALATMHDSGGASFARAGAGLDATMVDAFCPDERGDLEEGVRLYEEASGVSVGLPPAP